MYIRGNLILQYPVLRKRHKASLSRDFKTKSVILFFVFFLLRFIHFSFS